MPVCAPAIARRLKAPRDLAGEVFLHDTAWHNDWNMWLSKIAPNENLNKSGPAFSLYALAIEECKNGAGILMGHEDLMRRQLEHDRLCLNRSFFAFLLPSGERAGPVRRSAAKTDGRMKGNRSCN